MSAPDVVVIGGGLVGTACAYELAVAGASVVVVDRHDAGRATDAGAGILSPETLGGFPEPLLDLADAAGAHYRELIPALAELGAPDPSYDECGALRIAFREGDDEWYRTNVDASIARHPDVLTEIAVDTAREMFPPLGEIRAATFNPRGARVDGRALQAALAHAARGRGVEWRHASVTDIESQTASVAVTTTDGGLSAGAAVVAGGAWTPELAARFGMRVGVRPVRGQIVHLGLDVDTSAWPVLQPILSHYVVPWRDRRVALGATVEDAGFDPRATIGGLRQLFAEGLRVNPGLVDATFLEVRVGLRPMSDDNFPIIGALPGAPHVFTATGHGAEGLLLGPLTGRLIAELVHERTPAVALDAFSPARLGPG